MDAEVRAGLARPLAVALACSVVITCGSPTSPTVSKLESPLQAARGGNVAATVTVALATPEIAVGDTTKAFATVRNSSGNVIRSAKPTWSSSDPTIATVGSRAEVVGRGNGSAQIIASVDGVSGTATLIVTDDGGSTTDPVARLSVVSQPTSGTAGTRLTPDLVVELQDDQGRVVSTATADVSVALTTGTATLTGTTTVGALNGVVRFSDLAIIGVGSFTLTVTSESLPSVTSGTIVIAPGPPAQLAIVTQPSLSAVSGQPFATQPVIGLRDAYGHATAVAGINISASIASGGGTLGGTTTISTDASGVGRFTNLSISGSAGDRTLVFASSGLTSVTSRAITITASSGDSRGLVFASDWSSGTGTSDGARRDVTKPRPWAGYGGNAVTGVETAASLGLTNWPTANAFVVRTQENWMGSMWSQLDVDLGVPAPGSHRYFRVYVAMLWEDDHGDGSGISSVEHGIETSQFGYSPNGSGGGGDGLNPMMLSRSTGVWHPAFREISSGYRYVSDIQLPKFATYRLEWHIAYGTGNYRVEIRIYDAAGTLVVTEADFWRGLPWPQGELLRDATLALADATDHRWFRVGSNGPTSNYPDLNVQPLDAFRAHGAVAICTLNWCGPYVPGERP
jgi:hypothetical protein